ncbi:histidinol-phosphatase HisJ [Cohnella sp. REN36]|uniref:histidinol-phosphatase HisJ n=1 Tax=Cohnella sp. REN36 TaxID=2887347 RepID=UPI001D139E2C|nr:histidinol-phosphatase HisJ [Cohnella sp. REN36]MCC3376157.1 histidinol-phosphatase HisJ [Cohnella sp. REN36]
MTLKWDGHTHTKFCYHGNKAETPEYLERAIALGFERYTISEHPPLPAGWIDNPKLMAELAMPEPELPDYFAYITEMKARYADRIEVTLGLEMDYLHGNEAYSNRILAPWLDKLEDVVVSVHYLPGRGGMRCIDFTPDDFQDAFLEKYGSMTNIIDTYFDHVEHAIAWASTLPMRKRIGHPNLIRKFQRALPPIDDAQVEARLLALVPKLREAGVGVDVNVAGFRVATCGESYVPDALIRACREAGVELVYGSDTHRPEHVGADWDWYAEHVLGARS